MQDIFADVNSVTAGLNIPYVYVDELEAPAAAVDQDGVKLILINRAFLEQIPGKVLRTVVEKGLRVHEGDEHRYHNIPERSKTLQERNRQGLNQSFWASVENLVGDAHVDAKGLRFHPNLGKYRTFVLSRMWELQIQEERFAPEPSEFEKTLQNIIEKIRKKNGIEVNPALLKTMNAFFEAVKLGEVQKKNLDENVLEDLRFIVPRVFLSRRGKDCHAIFQAADEIYHYLDKKYRIPPELIIEVKFTASGLSQGNSDMEGERWEPVLPWRSIDQVEHEVRSALEDVKTQLEKAEREGATQGGLLGGPDHTKLTPPTVRDIQFYVETVRKHLKTIARLQRLLSRMASKRFFVSAKEGDLNLKPSVLQQAYVDSFRPEGETERNNYLVMRRSLPESDFLIAQDSSGSTYGAAPLFSEATICILEAAKRVGRIRTGVVSFGNGIRVLKDISEPVEAGRFYPQCDGGTPLGSALEQILKLRWRRGDQVRKIVTILTDGYPDPDQWSLIDRVLAEMRKQRMTIVALCVGIEANEDYRKRFDQVYQIMDASDLTDVFLRSFVENALLVRR